jgi:exodeoxyribonuclease VII small subunit
MTTQKPFEFEQALKELEEITTWFESTHVDLDQGLVKFERGMELASQLKTHLAGVENRVEKIKQRFAAGTTGQPADAPDHQPPNGPNSTDLGGLFGA